MCAGLMTSDELKSVPDGVSGKVFNFFFNFILFYFFKYFFKYFSRFPDMTVKAFPLNKSQSVKFKLKLPLF